MAKQRIDLGREAFGVTWNEWMGRSGEAALKANQGDAEHLRMVVTLRDGRRLRVLHTDVHTHDPGEQSPVAIITGYVFSGYYATSEEDDRLVSIAVTPDMIGSVEWMRVAEENSDFGFRLRGALSERIDEVADNDMPEGSVSLVVTQAQPSGGAAEQSAARAGNG
jgi:hypothetical protein